MIYNESKESERSLTIILMLNSLSIPQTKQDPRIPEGQSNFGEAVYNPPDILQLNLCLFTLSVHPQQETLPFSPF